MQPRTKTAIVIDIDQLRDLMQEFIDEMKQRGHATIYGADSLEDWKLETFLQWLRNKQKEQSNVKEISSRRTSAATD